MARTVPGSGAAIEPVFNSVFGVKDVIVVNGGSGYDRNNPPKLTIGNCGTPVRDAVLRPIIGENGEILAVDVIDPGEGYDPLRVIIDSDDPDTIPTDVNINLNPDGSFSFLQVTQPGDGYFSATAQVLGGGGSGVELVPITGGVTGLSIEANGRNYSADDVTLVISGGGGQGATGVADANLFGSVSDIRITNPGEFFQTSPLIQIIGGGGSGAQAEATIELGKIKDIKVLNPGGGYTSNPNVIFTRDTNLIRAQRNRTSLRSSLYNMTAIIRDAGPQDTTLYVETTNAFPGSGKFQVGTEIIRYTGKTAISFTGCSRGINFRYDQRVILDSLANNPEGISGYSFSVADRIRRVEESKTNKVAIVYDWKPTTRELFLTFEVDELAFIEGGQANEKTAVIQFIAGVANSSGTGVSPHVILESAGSRIYVFEDPINVLNDFAFQDDDELDGAGDGIIDLVNIGTDYENEINLDGGIAASLYGIEETFGGQNTTLFQQGDQVYDSNLVPLVATVQTAGSLNDGVEHNATTDIILSGWNNVNFLPGETVYGDSTGVTATVVSFDPDPVGYSNYVLLRVDHLTNNGNTYKFTTADTIMGNSTGAFGDFWKQEYTNIVRNEPE
jgi:hypothetical protein